MSMENDNPKDKLFNSPDNYVDNKYQDHLLEQYKLYIQMADKISDRRATANTFFLSLNSFLLTVLGILPQLKSNIVEFTFIWIIVVSFAGIVFCLAWIMLIRGYRKLNEAKFYIINTIESTLPVTMYDSEWKYLEKIKEKIRFLPFRIGYSPLSMVERWVPTLIIFLYISLMIGSIAVSFNFIELPFEAFK
jgi:hypothetical protein